MGSHSVSCHPAEVLFPPFKGRHITGGGQCPVLAALWHCAVFIITHQFVMSSSSWNAGVGASYSGGAAAFTTGSKYVISLCACRGHPLRKRTITTRQPASLSLSLYSRPVCRFLSVSYLVLRRLWLHCVTVQWSYKLAQQSIIDCIIRYESVPKHLAQCRFPGPFSILKYI